MSINSRLRLELFQRVEQFDLDYASSIPEASHAAALFKVVTAAIVEIEGKAAAQATEVGSAKGTITTKALARNHLQDAVEEINRTARAISMTLPGVLDKFRMPSSDSDQALLTAARAFAINAEPLKAEFIKRSLAETFLTDLGQAIAEFEGKIGDRDSTHGSQIAATAALGEPFERAMTAVQELRLIMPNLLKKDPAASAAWTSASRMEHHSSRKEAKPAPPGGTPDPSGGQTPGSSKPPGSDA